MDDKLELVQRINDFIILFLGIFTEALPWIVLGAAVAGVLEEFLPQRLVARYLPRNRFLAIGLGGLFGLVFPMCECGIIPVMRRLLGKGLPLSFCVAYLLAGPIVNPIVLLNTFQAFWARQAIELPGQDITQPSGWLMVAVRGGMGFVVACVTAAVVERVTRGRPGDFLKIPARAEPDRGAEPEEARRRDPFGRRLARVSAVALHDFIDITVFLLLGALLAATVQFYLAPNDIARLTNQHPALTVLMMMGLAVVLCLCSEADAFFAATFLTMPPAGKLAFLVLGPMLDLKLYAMYTRLFRPRLIATIVSLVVLQVFVFSLAFHYAWEGSLKYGPPTPVTPTDRPGGATPADTRPSQ